MSELRPVTNFDPELDGGIILVARDLADHETALLQEALGFLGKKPLLLTCPPDTARRPALVLISGRRTDCSELAEVLGRRGIPVVVAGGCVSESRRIELYGLGAKEVIDSPFTLSELRGRLSAVARRAGISADLVFPRGVNA